MLLLMIISLGQICAQNERYYVDKIANVMGGIKEYKVQNGRVDLVTDTHAIEVEWASNWKHSIGQALWYALQTNKQPGIMLIMKSMEERKYGIMLQSALDYAGLSDRVKVWFYPEDFGESIDQLSTERETYKQNLITGSVQYTRNKKSGVRHNSHCTHFNCSNCVPCGPMDGKACGKCRG